MSGFECDQDVRWLAATILVVAVVIMAIVAVV